MPNVVTITFVIMFYQKMNVTVGMNTTIDPFLDPEIRELISVIIPRQGRFRSSLLGLFCKKGVLKNFTNITRIHLCQSLFFLLKKLTQVFSCKFCEAFKITYFSEHMHTAPSSGINSWAKK